MTDIEQNIIDNFNKVVKKRIDPFKHINPYKPVPQQSDYKKGYIKRYFTKKKDDFSNVIYEVNKKDYMDLKGGSYSNKILYKFTIVKWRITGSERDIYKNDILVEQGVCEHNSKIALITERNFPGIKNYLKNCLEYYREI